VYLSELRNQQTGVRPAICAILWNSGDWSTPQHLPIFFAPYLIPDEMITSFVKTRFLNLIAMDAISFPDNID
jgi:hypothetical protein